LGGGKTAGRKKLWGKCTGANKTVCLRRRVDSGKKKKIRLLEGKGKLKESQPKR